MDATMLHIALDHLSDQFFENRSNWKEAFPTKETPNALKNASIIIDFDLKEVKLDAAGAGGGIYKVKEEHTQTNGWPNLKGTLRVNLAELLTDDTNLKDLDDPQLEITHNLDLAGSKNYSPKVSLKVREYIGSYDTKLDETEEITYGSE